MLHDPQNSKRLAFVVPIYQDFLGNRLIIFKITINVLVALNIYLFNNYENDTIFSVLGQINILRM